MLAPPALKAQMGNHTHTTRDGCAQRHYDAAFSEASGLDPSVARLPYQELYYLNLYSQWLPYIRNGGLKDRTPRQIALLNERNAVFEGFKSDLNARILATPLDEGLYQHLKGLHAVIDKAESCVTLGQRQHIGYGRYGFVPSEKNYLEAEFSESFGQVFSDGYDWVSGDLAADAFSRTSASGLRSFLRGLPDYQKKTLQSKPLMALLNQRLEGLIEVAKLKSERAAIDRQIRATQSAMFLAGANGWRSEGDPRSSGIFRIANTNGERVQSELECMGEDTRTIRLTVTVEGKEWAANDNNLVRVQMDTSIGLRTYYGLLRIDRNKRITNSYSLLIGDTEAIRARSRRFDEQNPAGGLMDMMFGGITTNIFAGYGNIAPIDELLNLERVELASPVKQGGGRKTVAFVDLGRGMSAGLTEFANVCGIKP
ncbi:MAG: hypothetical protein AAFY42_00595 [Pseudomonadota bacterium]